MLASAGIPWLKGLTDQYKVTSDIISPNKYICMCTFHKYVQIIAQIIDWRKCITTFGETECGSVILSQFLHWFGKCEFSVNKLQIHMQI